MRMIRYEPSGAHRDWVIQGIYDNKAIRSVYDRADPRATLVGALIPTERGN